MDILVINNKAHELFPNGAPELHPDLLVVKDYAGEVKEGWDWNGTEFTEPEPDGVLEEHIRIYRNSLLIETDHHALEDGTLTEAMAEYRQALRDVTLQEGWPDNIIWPEKPED